MKHTAESSNNPLYIAGIEVTPDALTSRAGLTLFARYLDQTGLGWFPIRWLGPLRKSAKGLPAAECVRQERVSGRPSGQPPGSTRHLFIRGADHPPVLRRETMRERIP